MIEQLKNMTPFDELEHDIQELYDEAKNWADGEPISSKEQHDAVTEIFKGLQKLGKKAEEMRKTEVKPHDDAKKAVQERFNKLIGDTKSVTGTVVRGKKELNTLLAEWRAEQLKIKEAEAAELRAKAEADRLEAEEAIRASSGNIEEREKAEELLADAQDTQKMATQFTNKAAKSKGVKSVFTPEITDAKLAIKHYWVKDQQPFIDLVNSLAKKDVNAGVRDIAGFKVTETKVAV